MSIPKKSGNLLNAPRISHLSFLSKLLEKVVAGQINKHLLINNLHGKFQSANGTGFSTETALIKITSDIWYVLDNKSFAFDTVDHTILLNRLSKCIGIDNTALDNTV